MTFLLSVLFLNSWSAKFGMSRNYIDFFVSKLKKGIDHENTLSMSFKEPSLANKKRSL